MTERSERIGESHITVSGFAIEAGKVAEFARAVFDDNPAHYDADAASAQGFDAVPAPLTFTRTGTFPRYRTGAHLDLGFQHEYVLHGEHSYEYERPLLVGDVLTGETTLSDIYEREGDRGGTMQFAEVETVYRDRSNERVLAERSTVIRTDGPVTEPDDGDDPSSNISEDGTESRTPCSVTEITDTTVPDPAASLEPGDTIQTVAVGPLKRSHFVRYAGASGDFNPIHYDEPYARAAGNQSVFGQGMFTAGVAAHAVADWFGLERVRTFSVRFRSRVWPGDTIRASAVVTDSEPVSEGERVDADIRVVRDDDETVLTGRAGAILTE